jgi:phospholipase/lecithinase/hemolysin
LDAGARHVVVTGVQNVGLTPWALRRGEKDAIERLSVAFNDALLIDIADLGSNVLYFDAALFFNLMNNEPDNYNIVNASEPVCSTPDASTCTPSTVVFADYNRYLYADSLNFTPERSRRFMDEDYAENMLRRFKDRW